MMPAANLEKTASVYPDPAAPESLPLKNGKPQLSFGRAMAVEYRTRRYLQELAETCKLEETDEAGADQVGKEVSRGNSFFVVGVTRCEPSVALRIPLKANCDKTRRQVLHDCELAPRLQHDNIVPFLAVLETQAHGLVEVLPLYDGDLFSYLSHRIFHAADVRNLIIPIGHALSWLHDQKIVHSDVKPENCLYRRTGEDMKVVLADFGLAGESRSLCGTFVSSYFAPEVCRYWWENDASPMALLAGVDFAKMDQRLTCNDVWSFGFMMRVMMDYFDREKDALTVIRAFLSPSRRKRLDPVGRLVDKLVARTSRAKLPDSGGHRGIYCCVEETPESRQGCSQLLNIAREAMAVSIQVRPNIRAVLTALESVPGKGVTVL